MYRKIMYHNIIFSVVTISKDNRLGLLNTLKSVSDQDYSNIEHIVIDGDSADGSQALLENFPHSKKYSWSSSSDTGISNAFNKGLDRITGELVLFLNSGDEFFSKETVSQIVRSYCSEGWICASGTVGHKIKHGQVSYYSPPRISYHFLSFFMFLPHQGFICESQLHRQYKFSESIKTSMDYDLFLRMLKGVKIYYLDFIVSVREPGGISSDTAKRISEQSHIRLAYSNSTLMRLIIKCINLLIYLKCYLKIGSPFSVESSKIR